MGILRIESFKKGIIYSTFFNLLTKIIGFVSNILIAYFFGTQLKSDVYFYSFATLTLIASFLTNINSIVIIPESMRIRLIDEKEGMNFINFFFIIYLIIGLLVTIVLYVIPVSSFTFFSKFNTSELENNIGIIFFIIPYFFFYILTTFLLDILISYKYFTMPMLVSILTNLFSIIIVLTFKGVLGISSVAFSISFSYFLNTLILFFILIKQVKWRFFLKNVPISKLAFKNLSFAILSNITTVLGSYVPLYLISGFNGGVITALNYGRNLANIPDQFITIQFSSILGIKLNEIYSKGDFKKLNDYFIISIKALFFVLIPLSLFFFFFSKEIISIVYMRGAFNLESVKMTSFFFKYFALTLPFLAINTITSRLFAASQKISASFYSGVVINILFLILLYIYITFWGPNGYPFAILTYLPLSVLGWNFYLCKKIFPYIMYGLVFRSFIELLILNLTIILPIYFLYYKFLTGVSVLLALLICSVINFLILFFVNWVFKVNKEIYMHQEKIYLLIKKKYDFFKKNN